MAQVSIGLARLKRDSIGDLPISVHFEQICREQQVVWRRRLLPPWLTLRLFLIQIFNGNVAIAALRQLAGIDFAPSSYSDARKRLPLQVLQSLLLWLHQQAELSRDGRGTGVILFSKTVVAPNANTRRKCSKWRYLLGGKESSCASCTPPHSNPPRAAIPQLAEAFFSRPPWRVRRMGRG